MNKKHLQNIVREEVLNFLSEMQLTECRYCGNKECKGCDSSLNEDDPTLGGDVPDDENEASKQAHHLGLTSKPYGNWADKTGKVVARTVDGKLVKIEGEPAAKTPSATTPTPNSRSELRRKTYMQGQQTPEFDMSGDKNNYVEKQGGNLIKARAAIERRLNDPNLDDEHKEHLMAAWNYIQKKQAANMEIHNHPDGQIETDKQPGKGNPPLMPNQEPMRGTVNGRPVMIDAIWQKENLASITDEETGKQYDVNLGQVIMGGDKNAIKHALVGYGNGTRGPDRRVSDHEGPLVGGGRRYDNDEEKYGRWGEHPDQAEFDKKKEFEPIGWKPGDVVNLASKRQGTIIGPAVYRFRDGKNTQVPGYRVSTNTGNFIVSASEINKLNIKGPQSNTTIPD